MSLVSSGSLGPHRFVMLVHGGAGTIDPGTEPSHARGCGAAAERGRLVLMSGGSALDAVEAAVRVLEDDPTFNAGTGGALNEAGALELDACIMHGPTLRAGAVCGLPPFRNPISVARKVMEDSPHVLLAGAGAARFALRHGFLQVEPGRMISTKARMEFEKGPKEGGTVGAVALDLSGGLAAATSTGGKNRKLVGRVGDSPIPGAGTYANQLSACSATGDGEAFLRTCATKRAVDLSESHSVEFSLRRTLSELVAATGSEGGGLIALNNQGHWAIAHTTKHLAWAVALQGGTRSAVE